MFSSIAEKAWRLGSPFGFCEALPLGIFILDSNYQILYWNRFLENATGWLFKDLKETDARLKIPALTNRDYRIRLRDVFRTGVPAVFSPQLHAPLLDPGSESGPGIQIQSTTVTAMKDPDGSGYFAVIVIQDITDITRRLDQSRVTAQRLERELQRSRELEAELERIAKELQIRNAELNVASRKAALVIESVPNGIVVIDPSGQITLANASVNRMFGYTGGDLIGQPIDVLLPIDTRAVHGSSLRAFNRRSDVFAKHRDGSEIPVEIGMNPIEHDGQISMLCSIVDITDRKLAERKILQAAQMKSEFLANMSHEIRTPMNVIVGMSGLLLETELSPDQLDFAGTIRKGAESLLGIINGVLDFSKLEAHKLEADPEDFCLDTFSEDIVHFFALEAHRKGLELYLFIDADLPSWLRGDRGRLRQILINLIGNAIKFTERGEVSLHVLAGPAQAGPNRTTVRFEVRDTGIGISEDVQTRVFEAFTQADGSTTRRFGGSGLGLAISKRLAEVMGGDLGVSSRPGQGSTFWLELPFESPVEIQEADIEPPIEPAIQRLLIVSEQGPGCAAIQKHLQKWNLAFDAVHDGIEAIARMRECSQAGMPYDAVLLDYRISGINGVDVARIISLDPRISATGIIVLLDYEDRNCSKELTDGGNITFLHKPVRRRMLWKSLQRAHQNNTKACGHKPPPVPVPHRRFSQSSGSKILLVEDNEDNQKLARRLLEKHGYQCDVASHGVDAIEKFEERSYPLVLMDCQMPIMDGFQATAEIRRLERDSNRRTPIIAVTAHALLEDREKCLAAGMDDYLSKPIEPASLIATLQRWIPQDPEPVPGPSRETIFVQAKAGIEGLIPGYLANRKKDLILLSDALKRADFPAIKMIGHGMKGSGGGYGFPAITEMGRLLENAARETDHAEISRQISCLDDYLDRLEVVF